MKITSTEIMILFGILAVIMAAGCSEEVSVKPQTQITSSYCIDSNTNGICDSYEAAETEAQQAETTATGCSIEGLKCSMARITEKKIQFSIKNTLDRDIIIHSVSFEDVNCERTFDEKLFRTSTEAFIIPCSLNPGDDFSSDFTLKYVIGDATVPKQGSISGTVEREN
jgi:hypothetical protein